MPHILINKLTRLVAPFLLVFFLVVLFSHQLHAQTAEQYIKQGDKSYADADYYTAFYYFNKAKDIDSSATEAIYKMAEASRNINDYKNALTLYERVLKTDKYKSYPLAEFWMGMMSKYLGNYTKAGECFRRFVDRYSFQDYYKKKAYQEQQSAAWIRDHDSIDRAINVERMGNEINTQFSEFAASELHDSFYQFSSIREVPSSIKQNNKEFLSRIYTMKLDNNEWKENKELFAWLDTYNEHIANGTFSEDGKRFYFNVCQNKNSSDLRCDIYVSRLESNSWQLPIKLNDDINPSDATNTQPYEAENKILYFVSDRKGGEGKLDIWYSELSASGNYSAPYNLGKTINSADNEISPFFDAKTDKLYFSSDWFYGYGGYDVFFATKKKNEMVFDEPENIGMPINSSCNDIYFNFNPEKHEGYLASNRKGSMFLKGESCCNDIYKFKYNNTVITKDSSLIVSSTNTPPDTAILATTNIITPSDTMAQQTAILLQKLKSMLPVTVYFHNDIPDPRSTADTTMLNYKSTYDAYALMKNEYVDEFQKSTKTAASDSAIIQLFDQNIDEGYRKLLLFTTYLKQQLLANKNVTITLEGYCSPLALNEYNVHLANRRITSLKNYFYDFDNGFFRNYLATGKLIYKNAPFGEEKANPNISDNRLDTPNSVYHPRAALERKVAIIAIE